MLAGAAALAGCVGFGVRLSALPPDAAAQGYRVVGRPLTLPRGRVSADCGPEALAAILRYWGRPADVDEITARIYRSDLEGTLSTALPPAARERGLSAELLPGSVGRIRQAIEEEVPPLIMVEIRPKLFHFFPVVGFNDRTGVIVCEDYEGAKVLISYEKLEAAWKPAGFYYLELRPADAHADARAGMDFEAKGDHRRAIEFYRRAIEKDPQSVDALLGLGNCLYATGARERAREAYEKALALAPEDAKVNNNLADLYLSLGTNLPEAERMADKAVELLDARRRDLEKELPTTPSHRRQEMRRELRNAELDLAGAFGTLGQARAANGRHELAVGAWKASLALIPLTEGDWRARRLLEIGKSYAALGMGHEARKHWTEGLEAARDPELRRRLEELLR